MEPDKRLDKCFIIIIAVIVILFYLVGVLVAIKYTKKSERANIEKEIVYVMAGMGNNRLEGTSLVFTKLINGDTIVTPSTNPDIRFESQKQQDAKSMKNENKKVR